MTDTAPSSHDALHLARSRFLNAFATVEYAVHQRLIQLDQKRMPLFSQTVEVLRKAKAAPRYSKVERNRVAAALDSLAPLHQVRNDVVHGMLHQVRVGETTFACLINPQEMMNHCQRALLVSVDQFSIMERQLRTIAAEIASRPSQASSPPRPSPGAAGDP